MTSAWEPRGGAVGAIGGPGDTGIAVGSTGFSDAAAYSARVACMIAKYST